jgi:hypothetical protein
MDREWKKTDQYKAIQKAKRAQAWKEKVRRALEREARERDAAERKAKYDKQQASLAAQKAKRESLADRARRSRIDWSELLDNPTTVKRQIQWERQTTALAMRKAGLTYRAIGERMGLSGSATKVLVWHAERRKPGAVSPAEAFMNAEMHKEVQDLIYRKAVERRKVAPVSVADTGGFMLMAFGG